MANEKVREGDKVDLLVDCLAVQLCSQHIWKASRFQATHAGIWKQPMMRNRINTIYKIKSHITEKQARESGTDMSWYEANQAVDALANDALRDEKYPEEDEWVEAVGIRISRMNKISAALADSPMEGWAARERKSAKSPYWKKEIQAGKKGCCQRARLGMEAEVKHLGLHKLRGLHSQTANRSSSSAEGLRQGGLLVRAHLSHKLQLSQVVGTRQPVVWCSRCGCYSSGRKAGILRECKKHRAFGYKALRSGLHPVSKQAISKPVRIKDDCQKGKQARAEGPANEWEMELCQALFCEAEGQEADAISESEATEFWEAEHVAWCGAGEWAGD
jgi:hypothetical protein